MITIVENYEGNNSWYRKWSNGLMEQGGVLMRTPGTDEVYAFTFPFPFQHTALTFKATWLAPRTSNSGGGEPAVKSGTLSNTGVTLLNDHYNNNKIGMYWEAKGY